MSIKHQQHSKSLYKPEEAPEAETERWTFILPFVVLSLLALPSLLVLAYGKQTMAFDLLAFGGVYSLVVAALWVAVPLAFICGVLYLVRGTSRAGKAAVATMLAVVLACFAYIVWPR